MKLNSLYLMAIALFLGACSTEKYIYLAERADPEPDSSFHATVKPEYQLQPGDVLYISIHSTLSETTGMFHFPGQEAIQSGGSGNQNGSMYLNQSVISDAGEIRIPTLGKLFVAGSTVKEVEEVIETETRKYVSDAIARVKLVSYEISFLGEFNNPGKITFYKDRIHVLDAIAEAGEITYFGDRRKVRIMRETPKGMNSYTIDLTDAKLIESEKFYLKPNDIVYVEPLPRKIFRINAADYSLVLATVTSTLALVTLIVSLNN